MLSDAIAVFREVRSLQERTTFCRGGVYLRSPGRLSGGSMDIDDWRSNRRPLLLAALAFPPLFHLFVRGQSSFLVLFCFVLALPAFSAKREFPAAVALGLLIIKPQFLVAIHPVIRHGLEAALGSPVVRLRATRLCLPPQLRVTSSSSARCVTGSVPQNLPRSRSDALIWFLWTLLIPSPLIAFAAYVVSGATIAIAARVWKIERTLALRFSALTLAARPRESAPIHLRPVGPRSGASAPCGLGHGPSRPRSQPASSHPLIFRISAPALRSVSRWTHLQPSLIAFAALLCTLLRCPTGSHQLASTEARVV